MSQLTETQRLICEECDRIKAILLEKNRKYGDSAIHPVRCFSKASAAEQINVRLDDKISRMMSGQADEDEDVETDIIGYLVLKKVERIAHADKRVAELAAEDGENEQDWQKEFIEELQSSFGPFSDLNNVPDLRQGESRYRRWLG